MPLLEGWIKLWRKIQDSRVWRKREPLCSRCAFMWLLMNASPYDTEISIGNQSFQIKRGQLSYALRTLAYKWKWSKSKVARFLVWLSSGSTPELKCEHLAGQRLTLITIINYERYQGEWDAKWDNKWDDRGTAAGHERDSCKKEVRMKENKESQPPSAGPSEDTVENFLQGKTGFGKGGNKRNREYRDQIEKVSKRFVERLKEWGDPIEDEKEAVNKVFGLMMNLVRYGVAKKPKGIANFKGHWTDPEKAIELINQMSKPNNPVAELIDAFRKQPQYLR